MRSSPSSVVRQFCYISPLTAYENDPNLKFKIDFVTPRTVRIRMLTTPVEPKPAASIMLAKEPGRDGSWKVTGMLLLFALLIYANGNDIFRFFLK